MIKYYLMHIDSDDMISIHKYSYCKSLLKYFGLVTNNYHITCDLLIIEDE